MTSNRELAEALLQIFEQATDRQQAAVAVAAYLTDQRLTKELDSVLKIMEDVRFNRDGVAEITAESAHPLNEAQRDEILKLFGGTSSILHEEINKELIGGVRVRAREKVADFSVQARLRRLKAYAGKER